jgi:predicted phosphodiesterase
VSTGFKWNQNWEKRALFLAAIGDVAGNFPALRAVLGAVGEVGIETVVCTGNAVGCYPWPNECVASLRDRGVTVVQGGADRMTLRYLRRRDSLRKKLDYAAFARVAWTHEALSNEHLEYLRELPTVHRLTREMIEMVVCHGTPSSQADSLRESDPIAKFERQREATNAELLIYGNNLEPHTRSVHDALFVCPGAVTGPEGTARYALIDTEQMPWRVTFPAVTYDDDEVKKRMQEIGLETP